MKICHIITRMIIGGAQENTLLSIKGALEKGHDVTCVDVDDAKVKLIHRTHK